MLRALQLSHFETSDWRGVRQLRWLSITTIALILCLGALLSSVVMVARQMEGQKAAVAQRAEINGQIRALQETLLLLGDAETGQRGFLLTNKHRYLEPYERATREFGASIESLARMTSNDRQLADLVARIRTLMERKRIELAEAVRLQRRGDFDGALQLVQTDTGAQLMEQLRSEVTAVMQGLRAQRGLIEAHVLKEGEALERWSSISVAALFLCIGLVTLQLRGLAKARTRYELDLSTQSSVLNVVINEIPAMVAIWDRDLRYVLVNKPFQQSGSRDGSVIGKPFSEVPSVFNTAQHGALLGQVLRGETLQLEAQLNDASIKHVSITLCPLLVEGGEVGGVLGLAQDNTQHFEEKRRLALLSEQDSLTGLLNRAGLERVFTALSDSDEESSTAVLYVDLDQFKPVNDSFGHAVGDDVLRIIAHRLQRIVRPTDAIARIGGDEFVVLLRKIRSIEDARHAADKVVVSAANEISHDGHAIQIGASVGIAFDAKQAGSWQELLNRADQMTYLAKSEGRGRVHG